MTFARAYREKRPVCFHDILDYSKYSEETPTIAIGQIGDMGLIAWIDARGEAVTAMSFDGGKDAIIFKQGLLLQSGDIALLGFRPGGKHSAYSVFVFGKNGKLLLSKTIRIDNFVGEGFISFPPGKADGKSFCFSIFNTNNELVVIDIPAKPGRVKVRDFGLSLTSYDRSKRVKTIVQTVKGMDEATAHRLQAMFKTSPEKAISAVEKVTGTKISRDKKINGAGLVRSSKWVAATEKVRAYPFEGDPVLKGVETFAGKMICLGGTRTAPRRSQVYNLEISAFGQPGLYQFSAVAGDETNAHGLGFCRDSQYAVLTKAAGRLAHITHPEGTLSFTYNKGKPDSVIFDTAPSQDVSFCYLSHDHQSQKRRIAYKLVKIDKKSGKAHQAEITLPPKALTPHRLTRAQSGQSYLAGEIVQDDDHKCGLILNFSPDLENCAAKDIGILEQKKRKDKFDSHEIGPRDVAVKCIDYKFKKISTADLITLDLCDPSGPGKPGDLPDADAPDDVPLTIGNNTVLQSPYLNIQTAGSDGSDSAAGIQCRWGFAEALAKSHMPKGNYYDTNPSAVTGHNRPDDYVRLYKIAYLKRGAGQVLNLQMPADFSDHAEMLWAYDLGGRLVYLRFESYSQYQSALSSADPAIDPMAFFAAYGPGVLSMELRGELAFRCDLNIEPGNTPNYALRVEAFSALKPDVSASPAVTYRSTLRNTQAETILAQSLSGLKWSAQNCTVKSVLIHYYRDLLRPSTGDDRAEIEQIGKFALTVDDALAKARLETSDPSHIHDHWLKFKGAARVNTANYANRWADPDSGLKFAIEQYLSLSEDGVNPQANDTVTEIMDWTNDQDWEPQTFDISYLNFLNIAALDYHNARQIGQGYIDRKVKEHESWIYIVSYTSSGELDGQSGEQHHLSFSLPTQINDHRLPAPPHLKPVEYGLKLALASGGDYDITDAQGYTPDGQARYIALKAYSRLIHEQTTGFFSPDYEFDLSKTSVPVFLGTGYKDASAQEWARPEVLNDSLYPDTAPASDGGPFHETLPTLFPSDPDAVAILHKEMTQGKHAYALYAVNLFSRASAYSNIEATDETELVLPNRLLPPSNLHAQLIQEEDSYNLLLTTQAEQDMLRAIPDGEDKTLVRVVFDYNHLQENNYAQPPIGNPNAPVTDYSFADHAEFAFRQYQPRIVQGKILSVVPQSENKWLIKTQTYQVTSQQEIISPVFPSADNDHFVGSVFVSNQKKYIITQVVNPGGGGNPEFVVVAESTLNADDLGGSIGFSAEAEAAPKLGQLFMTIENMAAIDNWGADNPLSVTVDLDHPGFQPTLESLTDELGQTKTIVTRGFWRTATITSTGNTEYEVDIPGAFPPPTQPVSGWAGNWNSDFLPPPDQLSWRKGICRVKIDGQPNTPRRALHIEGYDDTKNVWVCSDPSPDADTLPIETGGNITVNIHFGYKLYLRGEAAKHFLEATTLPDRGDGIKNSLIGARSVDTHIQDKFGVNYASPMGTPAIMFGQEIIKPGIPNRPYWSGFSGEPNPMEVEDASYATPPDKQNKSSLSLDIEFENEPFAFTLLRVDILSIFRAVYTSETLHGTAEIPASDTEPAVPAVLGIYDMILPMERDESFTQRIWELLAVNEDTNTVSFSTLPLGGDRGDYQLPVPDHPDLFGPLNPPQQIYKDHLGRRVKAQIEENLIPLVKQPIIWDWMNAEPPHRGPQKIRDSAGVILPVGEIDIAPMATKNGQTVTFIDYSIDGAQSRDVVHFYCAREFGNKLQMGAISAFSAPIRSINTSPAKAPKIQKVLAVPREATDTRNPEILFKVIPPPAFEEITGLRIYRTFSGLSSRALRKMSKVKEIALTDLTQDENGLLVFTDDFSDDDFIPFGESLFYRICWIRYVPYVDITKTAKIAEATSELSRPVLTSIIDITNRSAVKPAIKVEERFDLEPRMVEFSWPKSAHNCTYSLCHLTHAGTWAKIAEVTSNDDVITPGMSLGPFDAVTEDGETRYHRFKVNVLNASGLVNLEENILTVNLADPSLDFI